MIGLTFSLRPCLSRRWRLLVAASEPNLTATDAPDIATLLGAVLISGTLAGVDAADAATAAGSVGGAISGTMAATEAGDGASLAGGVLVSGTIASTDAVDTAAMVGSVGSTISGTLAATDAPDGAAFAGGVLISGTLAVTEAPDDANLVGGVVVAGSLAATEIADAAAFAGGVLVSGTLSATDAQDTASMAGTVSDGATTERQAPDALIAQSNLTGAVTDIDEDPDSPDAAWLTADSDNSDSSCAVSFPTPTNPPEVGAGLQEFRLWLRLTVNGSACSYDVYLRESGVRLNGGAAIASGSLSSTTGEIVAATWDAALLGTASGAAVECEVVVTKSGGPPNSRTTGEIGAIEWNAYG